MDVVFTGTVVQKKDAPEEFSRTVSWGPDYPERVVPAVQVQFKVNYSWKGELTDQVTLYTLDPKESNWGYDFNKDGRYLVFARISTSPEEHKDEFDGKQVWTNWCSQNVNIDGFFGASKESLIGRKALFDDKDQLDETVQTFPSKKTRPFLHGVKNENELNKQLALFKLKNETGDEKKMQTDSAKDAGARVH
ncbi:MAG: hypothetical protein OXG24_04150 [Gammaproteobacteria bacterium]|nr:hypothetical protein [Gammaproteobacteria bacterium]